MKTALITGIYGQDGSLLAEFLRLKNYRVIGLVAKKKDRPAPGQAEIRVCDISDPLEMMDILSELRPDEFYHLAAAHHSSEQRTEADIRWQMLRVNFISTQTILEALLEKMPTCRFLFAGSSQMYSATDDITIIDENTPYSPSTYYGVTKAASANLISLWRRERALWGATAILFNHESPLRENQYITRKISQAAAAAKLGDSEHAKLGIRNMRARTDWSAAVDIVEAMWLMLQAAAPKDYVLASGKVRAVADLLTAAFQIAGKDWQEFIEAKTSAATPCLQGNSALAKKELGWKPRQEFPLWLEVMVHADIATLKAASGKRHE